MTCLSLPPAFLKKPAKKKSEDQVEDYRRFVSPDYIPSSRPLALARKSPYGPSVSLSDTSSLDDGQPPPDYYDRVGETESLPSSKASAASQGSNRRSGRPSPPAFLPGTPEYDAALNKVSSATRKALYELLRAEFKLLQVLPEKEIGSASDTPLQDSSPDSSDE